MHGHLERLPRLAGFVNNLRRVRSREGGAVLLLDGGDMWQGTLASNMTEGAAMVRAFNAMHYDAAAVGNHEFDYGPVGAAATPSSEDDDRRGALIARAREARFAILGANFRDRASGEAVEWSPIQEAVLIEREGVKIGVIGLATIETPETTISANVDDLEMVPLVEATVTQAQRLRSRGRDGSHCHCPCRWHLLGVHRR